MATTVWTLRSSPIRSLLIMSALIKLEGARLNGERKWNHQMNPLFSPRGSLFITLAVINFEGARLKRGKKGNTSYLLIISYSKLSCPKRTEWQLSLLYFFVVTCLFVWFNIHLLHFIHPIDAILIFIFFPFIHTIDAIYFL